MMRNTGQDRFHRSVRSLLYEVERHHRVLQSRDGTRKNAELDVQTQRRQRDKQRIQKRRRSEQRVDWTKKRRTDDHACGRNTRFDKRTQIFQTRKRPSLFFDEVSESNVLGSQIANVE